MTCDYTDDTKVHLMCVDEVVNIVVLTLDLKVSIYIGPYTSLSRFYQTLFLPVFIVLLLSYLIPIYVWVCKLLFS